MRVSAFWGARFESYEDCADKLARLLPAIDQAFGDYEAWLQNEGGAVDAAPDVIGRYMDQHVSEVTGDAFDDMGWCANFHRGKPRAFSVLRLRCGASAWIGNNISLDFPDSLSFDWRSIRSLIMIINEVYKVDYIAGYSLEAVRRRINEDPPPPHPIVDWMLYLANTIIPAEELPMVHSVERIGSGTLVILKKEPINLENPDDIALVEAVEPVIRRHQPDLELKPPPRRPRTI